jgi:hypothetical protein
MLDRYRILMIYFSVAPLKARIWMEWGIVTEARVGMKEQGK